MRLVDTWGLAFGELHGSAGGCRRKGWWQGPKVLVGRPRRRAHDGVDGPCLISVTAQGAPGAARSRGLVRSRWSVQASDGGALEAAVDGRHGLAKPVEALITYLLALRADDDYLGNGVVVAGGDPARRPAHPGASLGAGGLLGVVRSAANASWRVAPAAAQGAWGCLDRLDHEDVGHAAWQCRARDPARVEAEHRAG